MLSYVLMCMCLMLLYDVVCVFDYLLNSVVRRVKHSSSQSFAPIRRSVMVWFGLVWFDVCCVVLCCVVLCCAVL